MKTAAIIVLLVAVLLLVVGCVAMALRPAPAPRVMLVADDQSLGVERGDVHLVDTPTTWELRDGVFKRGDTFLAAVGGHVATVESFDRATKWSVEHDGVRYTVSVNQQYLAAALDGSVGLVDSPGDGARWFLVYWVPE